MRKSLLAAVGFFVATQIALSQTWNLTNSGSNYWMCVASSADGSTLIAGQSAGVVAVSTNAGAAWTTVTTNGSWSSVASSADGTKLLAADIETGVYLSTNSGVSWISNSLPAFYWSSVAISADGNTLAAVAFIVSGSGFQTVSGVFCSTNSGLNWVSNNIDLTSSVDIPEPTSVAMSADGSKIFVVASPFVFCSTNFGTSWMAMTDAPTYFACGSPSQTIASSADGNKLVLCIPGGGEAVGGVYISTDCGNTWRLTSLPDGDWNFVASSADGKTLMAAEFGLTEPTPLYISTNSGASWTTNTSENWAGVACSADGGALIAVAASDDNMDAKSGAIYRSQFIQPPLMSANSCGNGLSLSWLIPSTDFGLEQSADLYDWSAVTNTPTLNLANLQEQVVVSPTNGVGFYRLVH